MTDIVFITDEDNVWQSGSSNTCHLLHETTVVTVIKIQCSKNSSLTCAYYQAKLTYGVLTLNYW